MAWLVERAVAGEVATGELVALVGGSIVVSLVSTARQQRSTLPGSTDK